MFFRLVNISNARLYRNVWEMSRWTGELDACFICNSVVYTHIYKHTLNHKKFGNMPKNYLFQTDSIKNWWNHTHKDPPFLQSKQTERKKTYHKIVMIFVKDVLCGLPSLYINVLFIVFHMIDDVILHVKRVPKCDKLN